MPTTRHAEVPEDVARLVLIAQLSDQARARDRAEASIAGLVASLRDLGTPWARIGEALGVTRSGARARYGP